MLVAGLALGGCGGELGRLRFVSSRPNGASWAFVVDDRARGAELLLDGRNRYEGCNRAGRELRCEIRGLWPGGHTVELRLPGAVLRRSVVLGRPWAARPILVRAADAQAATDAATAGADAVVVDGTRALPGRAAPELLVEIVEAAHKKGIRVAATGPAELVETAGVDGVLDTPLPPELQARFPEARAFALDAQAGSAVEAFLRGAGPPTDWTAHSQGLVEVRGLLGGALGLLGPNGAIVDRAAFPLLDARRRHAALREGVYLAAAAEGQRFGATFNAGSDRVILLVNAGATPWSAAAGVPDPIDLLGSSVERGHAVVAAHDVALVIESPQPERTRY